MDWLLTDENVHYRLPSEVTCGAALLGLPWGPGTGLPVVFPKFAFFTRSQGDSEP
jgi:hypothetical protein